MRRLHHRESGQLLVPMCGLLVVFGLLLAGYVHWCRAIYWRTRVEMIADVTALSAARAQAQVLNRIAAENLMMNSYVQELGVGRYHFGTISVDRYPKFLNEIESLRNEVNGFKSFPAGVGEMVARDNGAEGFSPYFPLPMDPYLLAQTVYLLVRMPYPLPPFYAEAAGAFYARSWKPSFIKAQPSHRTTWSIASHGFKARATARLWLDVPASDIFHNGGFPRVNESFLHGLGIQSFYPQFNARLTRRASLTAVALAALGGPSDGR